MKTVAIPEALWGDVGTRNYHDAYFIDVKLRDGSVRRALATVEGKAITGTFADPSEICKIDFKSEDIVAVRPMNRFIPFLVTELLRKRGGTRRRNGA
jgi:hypothetical protein